MFRQDVVQVETQPIKIDCGALLLDDESRQEGTSARSVKYHCRLFDVSQSQDAELDLTQLDPVTSHLDLIIGSTVIVKDTLSITTDEVAGLVGSAAVDNDKRLGGQVGATDIAEPHRNPFDVELTDFPHGQSHPVSVAYDQPNTAYRPPDRDRLVSSRHPGNNLVGYVVTAFSRPVGIDQRDVRLGRQPTSGK
ncbi:hypothetical protein D3C76_1189680 [compost metagenome]